MSVNDSNQWFVYMVSCQGGVLYTGIAKDVKRRFLEHEKQGPKCAKYLRGKTQLQLVFSQLIGNRSQALKIEHKIKQLPKQKKLQLLKAGIYVDENFS